MNYGKEYGTVFSFAAVGSVFGAACDVSGNINFTYSVTKSQRRQKPWLVSTTTQRPLKLSVILPWIQFLAFNRKESFFILALYSPCSVTSGLRRPSPLACVVDRATAFAVNAALMTSQWQIRA